MTHPEDESKALGLDLTWVGRPLGPLTLVARIAEPPEDLSGGGRQGYSRWGGDLAGREIQTKALPCFLRGPSRRQA